MLPVILPHFSILVLVRIHRVCQTVYVGMWVLFFINFDFINCILRRNSLHYISRTLS